LGQGHRPRQRSSGGADPDGPGARQLHPRGGHHHDPLPRAGDPPSRLRRRHGRHPVSRAGAAAAPTRGMRLDVLFTPVGLTPAEVQGRTVFVLDILRATTAMCAALNHGAKAMIPVASTEEALRLAQTIGSADVLLAGEQNCVRIPGFHLGNSPLEMTESAVRSKTIIVTTTNGTKALLACQGAAAVYPACAANLSLAAEKAREVLERDRDLLVVCAGRDSAFSLDDAYCAGRLVAAVLGGRRPRRGLNDAGIAGLGVPVLGIGLALAGFERLGTLDMTRSESLIVGLSALLPYLGGVVLHVSVRDLNNQTLLGRLVGVVPGFFAVEVPQGVGTAGAVLVGFLALCALTLATFAWHPLQRLERKPAFPSAPPAAPGNGEGRGRKATPSARADEVPPGSPREDASTEGVSPRGDEGTGEPKRGKRPEPKRGPA